MAVVQKELNLVKREEWIAMPPKMTYPMTHPVTRVKFTVENNLTPCYSKDECIKGVKEIQNVYCDRGMDDTPYNFLVGVDGFVYEGRGWYNRADIGVLSDIELWDQTLDIGILGGFALSSVEAYDSVRKAHKAAQEVVRYGIEKNIISKDYKYYGLSDEVLNIDFESMIDK